MVGEKHQQNSICG